MRLLIIPVFLIILFPHFIAAQEKKTTSIDALAGKVITNLRDTPNEKIYLQTNKQVYGAGETIWLKAFIIDSITKKLTDVSKILFIDLVNNKDSVVSIILLQTNPSQTTAGIKLRDSLPNGYYWLRAYTRKMLHENINGITIKPVYVLSNFKNTADFESHLSNSDKQKPANKKIVINIYPEGGSIISGTNSTVAIKALDTEGNPVITSGIIKDNRDNVIANFTTNKQGLAKFSFSPKWYAKYAVYINKRGNFDSVAALPRVNLYAAQLSITEQNDQYIKTRVMLEDSIFSNDYTTYILAINGDSLCFAGIGSGIYELNIPVANFPEGVSHLLLYNAQKKFLSERKIYINKSEVTVSTATDKQNYSVRENVKFNIRVTDANGKGIKASLALSINDSRISDTANRFFSNPFSNYSASDIDLEMMASANTARYWILEDKPAKEPNQMSVDDILKISGRVVNNNNDPVQSQQVLLMSREPKGFYDTDTTNNKGQFSFSLPDYEDGAEFNLQVNNLNGLKKDYKIIADTPVLPKFVTPGFLKKIPDVDGMPVAEKTETRYMDSIFMYAQKNVLSSVTIAKKVRAQEPRNQNITSGIITHKMLQAGGANNAGDAVLRSGKFHLIGSFLMTGSPNGFAPAASDEPIVVVDGSQVPLGFNGPGSPVLGFLKTLPTDEIDYIKTIAGNEGSGYGVRGGHGVIEIHTSSKVSIQPSESQATTVVLKGFHVPPVFNMPDYNSKEIKKSKAPDLRTAIYWNGDIVTDDNGNAQVEFFTADTPATYLVTICGITITGDKIFNTTFISRR